MECLEVTGTAQAVPSCSEDGTENVDTPLQGARLGLLIELSCGAESKRGVVHHTQWALCGSKWHARTLVASGTIAVCWEGRHATLQVRCVCRQAHMFVPAGPYGRITCWWIADRRRALRLGLNVCDNLCVRTLHIGLLFWISVENTRNI